MWKELGVAQFKVLSMHLPGVTEKIHRTCGERQCRTDIRTRDHSGVAFGTSEIILELCKMLDYLTHDSLETSYSCGNRAMEKNTSLPNI